MTDPIEPLKELARRWSATHEPGKSIGSKAAYKYDIEKVCADELLSLLPALEAAFRLERAAALREAADKVALRGLKFQHDKCGGDRCPYCEFNRAVAEVVALADSDQKALDAHDAEVFRQGIEQGLATRMEAIEKVKAEVRDRALDDAAQWIADNGGEYRLKDTNWQAAQIRAMKRGSK